MRNKSYKPIILLIEDDRVSRLYVSEILKNHHYNLFKATNGNQALKQLVIHPEISLILMDILLPDINGFILLNYLRIQNIHLPIIAHTAHTAYFSKAKCISAGFDGVLFKPYSPNDLLEMLSSVLEVEC